MVWWTWPEWRCCLIFPPIANSVFLEPFSVAVGRQEMSQRQLNSGAPVGTSALESPFGKTDAQPSRLQFPIALMLLVTVVCTFFLSVILFAFRIPEVQGMVADLHGGSRVSKSSNHETQLRFLMVCYSSPLMLTGLTSVVYYVSTLMRRPASNPTDSDDDSPFS